MSAAPKAPAPLLADKVAIVSGVGPGLGRQIALALSQHGARVALGARTAKNLDEVVTAIRAEGGAALAVETDITERGACDHLVECCLEEFGRVDCLVNNAAIGYEIERFEDADLASWRRIAEINLFGSLELTQSVLPRMKEQGGGSIVFINSMNIRTGVAGQGGYSTSKGGLLVAARTLARELGRYDIRVNSVVPGWMDGPPIQEMFDEVERARGVSVERQRASVTARIPLGAIPSDADVAGAVVFFASDLARAITGQCLDANGGEFFD